MTGAVIGVDSDVPAVSPHTGRRHSDLEVTWRRVAPPAVGGALWGSAVFGPDISVMPFAAACSIVLTGAIGAAAAVVAGEPGRRGAGRLLGLAALVWPINSLGGWSVGPSGVLRALGEGLFWIALPAAVFLYQHPRLARPERWYLFGATVQFVGGLAACIAVSRPEWYGFAAHVWWPSVAPDAQAYASLCRVLEWLYPVNALAFTVLIWRRGRRSVALDRYSVAPMLVAVGAAALVAAISWSFYGRTTVAVPLVLLPLPVAFVCGALRLTQLRIRLAEALDAGPPGADAITAALREVLRDPTVEVRFWSPANQEWVDENGHAWDRSALRPGRWRVGASRRDGRVSAEVETVAVSASARRGVEAAVRLAGFAIENAGLRALVRVQLEASRRAHAQTLQAADDERRRLERDLHDGAQQRLHGVLLALARARRGAAGPPDALRQLDEVRAQLHDTLGELRELARGLHPGTLVRDGLPSALADVLDRLALPSRLDVSLPASLPPTVEAAIYFVISEAVINVVKHARADQMWVRVADGPAGIELEVADDGAGGADHEGHGMRGMADRLVALGGSFVVCSEPGHGTSLRGLLPR